MPASSQQEKFRLDALRWVIPGQIAAESDLPFALLLKLLFQHQSLRAMAWYRLACWCREKRIPGACGAIHRWIFFRFGLEIWGNIDGGLYIAHPIGAVIAVKSMGRNCSVVAAATLGMRNDPLFPTIGNEVFIGAGARVLGDISIGDGAKVGANAVVVHDVVAGDTVVGIPARPLPPKGNRTTAEYRSITDTQRVAETHTNGQIHEHSRHAQQVGAIQ